MTSTLTFHQCVHNTVWNMDSFINDGVGDFLVLSPRDLSYSKLIKQPVEILEQSIFDPQFYKPECNKKNIMTYDFFPNSIIEDDTYETIIYIEKSYEAAERCIDFQIKHDFKYILIPCLFPNIGSKEYYEKNNDLIYKPFLKTIKSKEHNKKILLSFIVSDKILQSSEDTAFFLNVLTSIPELDGIYLIPSIPRTSKRIKDIDILYSLMYFISSLSDSDLEVHLAYTDIEGFLLSMAFPTSLSMGSYENSRNFSLSRFESADSIKMPPNARLYSSKLLQWIDSNYFDSMYQLYVQTDELFDSNKYKDLMIRTEFNWHFTKPEPYKHFFISYSRQINSLPDKEELRYNYIMDVLINAQKLFAEIESSGIILDPNSNGDHIPAWQTALNRFAKYRGII